MKESRFIELLNLYLDCEIDSQSAAELEREILANRKRRRIYGDYCRVHRATRLVFERVGAADAESGSGSGEAPSPHFPRSFQSGRRRRSRVLQFSAAATVVTGLAAAIAIAVIPSPTEPARAAPAPSPAGLQIVTAHEDVQALPVVTFYAPFAADGRIDPYVRDGRIHAISPFSFANETASTGSGEMRSSLQNAASYRLGGSAEAGPGHLEFEQIQLSRPDHHVFRSNPNAAPVSFEPVGFEIHR